MKLEDDQYCFGCGSQNNLGLKLKFDLDKKSRTIKTTFIPRKTHQGFKDIVHGGLIGLILDECMVNVVWLLDIHAVSAEYTVKLKMPAAIGKKLFISAEIISEKTRMLLVEGKCTDEEGKTIATASAKCVKIK